MARVWVFDNDGTLYDDTRAHAQFQSFINAYCTKKFGWPEEEIEGILERLKSSYKTSSSIIALILDGRVEYEEAVESTYSRLDLPEMDFETETRNRVLGTIKDPRVVLTNNPSVYARRVLQHLGLSSHFEAMFGMQEMGFVLKPDPRAFTVVEQAFAGFDEIIFCDDSLTNLDAAARLGWKTVWYRPEGGSPEEVSEKHAQISSFDEIASVFGQA